MTAQIKLGVSAFKTITEHLTGTSVMLTLCATGAYVMYNDYTRFPKMINAYKYGKIYTHSVPKKRIEHYVRRPQEEKCIKEIFSSNVNNHYYVIKGAVGSGKSRTIVEVIKECMAETAKTNGAPVYITSAEGQSFAETLADAVNFNYDEHISLKFFIGALLGIESFPKHEESHKIRRVLDAIEVSATKYAKEYHKPAVIVVDGVEHLSTYQPETLIALQVKAKLWADANIVKLVFVSNDECTLTMLQNSPSNWSRAGHILSIDDLSKEKSIEFLTQSIKGNDGLEICMEKGFADKIYNFVGGRLVHLMHCKEDWLAGYKFEEIVRHLKDLEREKLFNAAKQPSVWKAIALLKCAPHGCMPLQKLIQQASKDDIDVLESNHIIKLCQDEKGLYVCFESKIIENIIGEFVLSR